MPPPPSQTRDQPIPAPAFAAGDIVGSYELLRPIHAGAFGQVWLGRHLLVPGDRRAVKVFRNDAFGAIELDGVRRYRNVADSQPGLVPIPEVGLVPGKGYYYTMPLADDINGRAVVRDAAEYEPMTLQRYREMHRPTPIDRVLGVAQHLLPALEALHEAGLVHRDIKPGNIVRVEGQWKFCDLGLLARRDEITVNCGTPGFVPPEGVKDRRADLYAFGVTLYLLATGGRPDDLDKFLEGRLTIPGSDARRDALGEVIRNACHPDADRRYQTALDMHVEINRLVRTTKLTVVLDDDFASFTAARLEEFVKAVRERGFHIHGVPECVEGSVRITLEMSPDDAEGLVAAIDAGELARFRVIRVEVARSPTSRAAPVVHWGAAAPGPPTSTDERPGAWREKESAFSAGRMKAMPRAMQWSRRGARRWQWLVAALVLISVSSVVFYVSWLRPSTPPVAGPEAISGVRIGNGYPDIRDKLTLTSIERGDPWKLKAVQPHLGHLLVPEDLGKLADEVDKIVTRLTDDQKLVILFLDDMVVAVVSMRPEERTNRGVGVGSTMSQVSERYDGEQYVPGMAQSDGKQIELRRYPGLGLGFEAQAGKVTAIVLFRPVKRQP